MDDGEFHSVDSRGDTEGSVQDWVAACGGKCKYDFVPFHWYGTKAEDMIKDAKVSEACPMISYTLMIPDRTSTPHLANPSGSPR